nr:hypothetical protein [Ruegeria sp. A3M17]
MAVTGDIAILVGCRHQTPLYLIGEARDAADLAGDGRQTPIGIIGVFFAVALRVLGRRLLSTCVKKNDVAIFVVPLPGAFIKALES